MVLLGFFRGVCFRTFNSCCVEILTKFPTALTLKSRPVILTNLRKHWEKFQLEMKLYRRKKTRTCQAKINLHDHSKKVKLLVLKLHHFCISHGGEVTLFNEMPMTRVLSDVIGVAQLCARYVYTASEVKFQVHSGTNKGESKAPLWKPVEARKIGLTMSLPGDFCSRNPKGTPFARPPPPPPHHPLELSCFT